MKQHRWPLFFAGLSIACTIVLNALQAHLWAGRLIAEGHAFLFDTALHQQQLQALGLLGIGTALLRRPTNRLWIISALLVLLGQILFSGNLYLICIAGETPVPLLTPTGGGCLIIGWVLFALGALRKSDSPY